ncbi:c-type cytochrome biogenesis protein CcmI [Paraferrimonas sedimenticola]|uniref:C-type cytochrome biogenesis protein CcmI n=1 Tax=Paraferrimonas sedimenticola TaxID=375674 RepID=A0AA37RYF8_9GAMM|nr:c-type cytochrome biogenesis protein CcmI [Paraferrimonas sedimenticola]GLP97710.1 c-type cytochrome biogenesis protein CcmI [Paraferrimonas sedimenticola]
MSTFWIFLALVLVIGLALIWVPHFRQQQLNAKEEAGVRRSTNLELFNERLSIMEKELADGELDQAEFDALKQELEIGLLQDIKDKEDESLSEERQRKSALWPGIMSLALFAIVGYMYASLGEHQSVTQPETVQREQDPHAGMDPNQLMQKRVEMFEAQVQQAPDNSQAWFSLGHAYMSASQYPQSIAAFDKVMELVGVHAELLGPKATAMYYQNGQKITPDVQAIIDESLSLDAADPSTLLLVAMDAFFKAEYQDAIDAWTAILNGERTDIDRNAILDAINTAKMRLTSAGDPSQIPSDVDHAGVDSEMPNDANHANVKSEMPNDADHAAARASMEQASDSDAAGESISVEVSVAEALRGQLRPTDMVFIYARHQGGGMPLAAVRLGISALPTTVVLDDSKAMSPQATISSADVVEIIATVSRNGDIRADSGDLQGIIATAEVKDDATYTLVIDKVIP